MSRIKVVVSAVSALLTLAISMQGSPSLAFANEGDFGETTLNINNDWVVYIDAEPKKALFNSKGNKFYPITNLRVSYRKTPRSAPDGEETQKQVYEDLWYHAGKPMGSHRFRKLGIERGKRGAIYVRTTNHVTLEPRAVANAITRLTLELLIRDSILTAIVVPRDMFREVITELGHYSFVPEVEGTITSGVQTNLYLTSNPPGMDSYLYFRKKR